MTIRELVVSLGFSVDKNSEKRAEDSIDRLKKMGGRALGALKVVFSIAGIGQLAQAAADVQALDSQFTQVFGDVENEAQNSLVAVSEYAGALVNRMKGSFTQLAAFTKTTGATEKEALEIAERGMKAAADSAAFYDRSLEEVTESLRSFLKGNYENDAALGLSATETTRNAAANKLYGKTFQELSEYQKQITLLQMVEEANAASGALGQAAREADTWTNQLGNLKQALKDLSAAAGGGILNPAVMVLKLLVSLTKGATAVTEKLIGENGALTRTYSSWFSVVKKLKPAVDRLMQSVSKGASKGAEIIGKLAERLGGMENLIKILTVAVTVFVAVMAWSKLSSGVKILAKAVSALGKSFLMAGLPVLKIVAIITVLVLLVEDFVHFLMGNDSLIGTVFDKLGIGADHARQAIFNAFNKVKEFLLEVWDGLSAAAHTVFSALADWWTKNGEDVLQSLREIWEGIKRLLTVLWESLVSIAKTVFGALAAFWNQWGGTIISVFSSIWNTLIALIGPFLNALAGIIEFLANVFAGDWAGAWESIQKVASAVWEGIKVLAAGAWEVLTALWSGLASWFGGIWESAKAAVSEKIAGIKDTIINGFQAAIDWITALPEQALQWGADIINGIVNGIKGAVGNITEAVEGVAGKIKSFLHFSVPDEGPLTDYESWMPDFMGGLAKGITENQDVVLDRIKVLASGMAVLMKGAVASASTAAGSTVSNHTSSVVQNVDISNSYSGGSAETQRNVSRAMKKSAVDATTQMARALSYARG